MSLTRNSSASARERVRGFTMVELLIAMSIAATLIVGVLGSYTFLARNLARFSYQQELEVKSRRMLQMFAQDVRAAVDAQASDYTADSSNRTNQITLTMSDGSTVQYAFNARAGTLTRVAGGKSQILLSAVAIVPLSQYQGFFCCFDDLDIPAGSQQGIRKIEVSSFAAALGTARSGTQTRLVGASARLVLRNKRPSS